MATSRLRELGATTGKGTSRWALTLVQNKREQIHHHSQSALSFRIRIMRTINLVDCLVLRAAEGDRIDSIAESPTGGYPRHTADHEINSRLDVMSSTKQRK